MIHLKKLQDVFFKSPHKENMLGGKRVHSCFDGNYAFGKHPPPIKAPQKIQCQNCGHPIWASKQSVCVDIINVCEPCYLMTFRGYVSRQAHAEEN